jgi:hypothetical protein
MLPLTQCPLCKLDLQADDIKLENHLADLHGSRIEVAKALTNILKGLNK